MTDDLSRVCALFEAARERVIIASAYLGSRTLDRLLSSVPKAVTRVAVFCRWSVQDIASGATDWRAWNVARAHAADMYACASLHAKFYVSDDRALVGSANATAAGLGGEGRGNLELLVPVDAAQEDVARVLALATQEAKEAAPIGADVAGDDGRGSDVGFWLPAVDPDVFLDVVRGRRPHTIETRRTCARLGVPEHGQGEGAIRGAVGETTLFRIVRHEFDTRPTPMTVERLRDLLVDKAGSSLGEVSTERLAPLVQWLGRFGTNTHAITSPRETIPTLYPGRRLVSYEFKE